MCRHRTSALVPLSVTLLALGPRAALGGGLFNKVAHVVKQADPKKVQDAVKEAVQDAKVPDAVQDAVKDLDPAKTASEALKNPEVTKAAGMVKDTGAKVAVTIKDPAEVPASTPAPTASPEKPDDATKKVGEALHNTGIAKMLQGRKPKDLANALKEATPKKVAGALSGDEVKKVSEAVTQDTGKVANALQDATPKDIAEAVKDAAPKDVAEALKDPASAKVGEALKDGVQSAVQGDPKKITGEIADAVQGATNAVQSVGAQNIGKAFEDTTAEDIHVGLSGSSKHEIEEAIRHPTEDKLKHAMAAVGRGDSDSEADSDDASSASTSFNWLLLVLLPLAAVVLGGWFTFVRLTRPKRVGSPMLAEPPNGTEGIAMMPGSNWTMGMGEARDFRTSQPANGFQRF